MSTLSPLAPPLFSLLPLSLISLHLFLYLIMSLDFCFIWPFIRIYGLGLDLFLVMQEGVERKLDNFIYFSFCVQVQDKYGV